jgi:hypothetical protein
MPMQCPHLSSYYFFGSESSSNVETVPGASAVTSGVKLFNSAIAFEKRQFSGLESSGSALIENSQAPASGELHNCGA